MKLLFSIISSLHDDTITIHDCVDENKNPRVKHITPSSCQSFICFMLLIQLPVLVYRDDDDDDDDDDDNDDHRHHLIQSIVSLTLNSSNVYLIAPTLPPYHPE